MNKTSYVNPKFELDFDRTSGKNRVSYSQFSDFLKCPLSWKLSNIDKCREREPSIHTVFGDSMHNVLQEWLRVMYTTTIKASEQLDLRSMLLEEMGRNYAEAVESFGAIFSTKEELAKFYAEGADTLMWIKRRRKHYFDPKNEILVGTEVPLNIDINGVVFVAYLDFVVQEKVSKKIKISDFKTSTSGWNDWMKRDETKIAQLILYKLFFAKQYNIPIDDISVEFLILKRKINEDAEYPEKKVQRYLPSQGKITYRKVEEKFNSFIKTCFNPDGTYNEATEYKAIAGLNDNNCKFCQYRERYDLCPFENRIAI